jgi:hypothetical protein
MRQLLLLAVMATLSLAGCTSDIGPAAHKAGIRRVKVEPRVDIQQPMRFGFDANSGNLSVALAGLIVNEMHGKRIESFGSIMASNEIRVPVLVRDRATELLRDVKKLEIATNAADGTFVVTIRQYGFDGTGFKNSKYVPFIVLKGQLLDRSGERVWSGDGQAHPLMDDDVAATFEDYMARPELLRQHWQHQIELALRKLLKAK